jgi:hypothetical protein
MVPNCYQTYSLAAFFCLESRFVKMKQRICSVEEQRVRMDVSSLDAVVLSCDETNRASHEEWRLLGYYAVWLL